jgi:hypothetical protein
MRLFGLFLLCTSHTATAFGLPGGPYSSASSRHATNLGTAAASSSSSSSTAQDEAIIHSLSAENWALLTERGRTALGKLMEHDVSYGSQKHVYEDWPPAGTDDAHKQRLGEQV